MKSERNNLKHLKAFICIRESFFCAFVWHFIAVFVCMKKCFHLRNKNTKIKLNRTLHEIFQRAIFYLSSLWSNKCEYILIFSYVFILVCFSRVKEKIEILWKHKFKIRIHLLKEKFSKTKAWRIKRK